MEIRALALKLLAEQGRWATLFHGPQVLRFEDSRFLIMFQVKRPVPLELRERFRVGPLGWGLYGLELWDKQIGKVLNIDWQTAGAVGPLWDQWNYADEARCHLWTSRLYDITEMRVGALHGFVANARVLIRGRHFLKQDLGRIATERYPTTLRDKLMPTGTIRPLSSVFASSLS